MSYKLAVVFGGVSNENEISVITGTMVCNILKGGGHEVFPVYISQEGVFFHSPRLAQVSFFKDNGYKNCKHMLFLDGCVCVLGRRGQIKNRIKVDCVVNCCHGGLGEGGGLSGVCAAAGLPLAGAGMFESAAFMDKYLTKILLNGLGIKTAGYKYFKREQTEFSVNFPAVVKPCKLGSSIGVRAVKDEKSLKAALDTAFEFDDGVIVEDYFCDRREINCAAYIYRGKIYLSQLEEAQTQGDILSFEDKYTGGGASVIPADIPEDTAAEIKGIAEKVYLSLNMRGLVRFDFILSGGEVYLSEVNTVPGSLAYYLFSPDFKNFCPILERLVCGAVEDFASSRKKLIATGILQNLPANACKNGRK